MEWTHEARVGATREALIRALTDRLPEVAAAMAAPCRVEVVDRLGDRVRFTLHTRWHVGELVPAWARPLLLGRGISWEDRSEWDLEAWSCRWSSTVVVAAGRLELSGVERYTEEGGATRFANRCTGRVVPTLPVVGRPVAAVVARVLPGLMKANVDDLLAAAARSC